ncbi:MAG TPA: hypothetical protein DIW46_04370, partial [Microbacterium sp.]|nr:hypothetical protein [Microbacterium sp.]
MPPIDEVPDLDQTRDRSALGSVGSNPRLEALVGQPRRVVTARGAGTDAVRLAALVSSASANSSPMTPPAVFSPAPNKKAKKPRGHRRIDWLNVGAAVVALVTAVGAGSFAG